MKANKQINPCGICGEDNPAHNFGCDHCGAPLDLELGTDLDGLPVINQKKYFDL